LQQQQRASGGRVAVVLTVRLRLPGAIASNDRETILGAAQSRRRVNATGVSLVNLQGVVVGDTQTPAAEGRPYPSSALVALCRQRGPRFGIRLHRRAAIPVRYRCRCLAPRPIAWVFDGFMVDDSTRARPENLSLAEVSFRARPSPG
jgi:hypothetical protein